MGWDQTPGSSRKELVQELVEDKPRHKTHHIDIEYGPHDTGGGQIVKSMKEGKEYEIESKTFDYSLSKGEVFDGEQEWDLTVVREITVWEDGKKEVEKHLYPYILKWFPPYQDMRAGWGYKDNLPSFGPLKGNSWKEWEKEMDEAGYCG